MNFNLLHGLEDLTTGIVIPIVLAIGATTVRTGQHGWHGWKSVLCEGSLSVFVGVTVHWGLTAYDVQPALVAAVVSASSYFCGIVLDAVRKRLIHEIMTRGRGSNLASSDTEGGN